MACLTEIPRLCAAILCAAVTGLAACADAPRATDAKGYDVEGGYRDPYTYGGGSPRGVSAPEAGDEVSIGSARRDFGERQREILEDAAAEARRDGAALAERRDRDLRAVQRANAEDAARRAERQLMYERQGATIDPRRQEARATNDPFIRQRELMREQGLLRRANEFERQRRDAADSAATTGHSALSTRTEDATAAMQRRAREALSQSYGTPRRARSAGIPEAAPGIFNSSR